MRLHWKRRGAPNSKSSSRSASSPPKIIGDGLNLPKLSVSHSAAADAAVARSKQPCNSMTSSSAHSLQCCCSCAQILPAWIDQRHSAGHTHGIKKNVDTIAQILPPATAQLLSSLVFRCIEDTDRQYMCGELATSLRLSWWNLILLYSICKNRRIGLQTCQWLCLNCVISDCGSYRAILSSYLFRIAKKKHLVAVI